MKALRNAYERPCERCSCTVPEGSGIVYTAAQGRAWGNWHTVCGEACFYAMTGRSVDMSVLPQARKAPGRGRTLLACTERTSPACKGRTTYTDGVCAACRGSMTRAQARRAHRQSAPSAPAPQSGNLAHQRVLAARRRAGNRVPDDPNPTQTTMLPQEEIDALQQKMEQGIALNAKLAEALKALQAERDALREQNGQLREIAEQAAEQSASSTPGAGASIQSMADACEAIAREIIRHQTRPQPQTPQEAQALEASMDRWALRDWSRASMEHEDGSSVLTLSVRIHAKARGSKSAIAVTQKNAETGEDEIIGYRVEEDAPLADLLSEIVEETHRARMGAREDQ